MSDAAKIAEGEMSRAMRLKLDRRIHNQRVALRENWEIMEARAKGMRRTFPKLLSEVGALLDDLGIPRGEGVTQFSIHYRIRLAREHLVGKGEG